MKRRYIISSLLIILVVLAIGIAVWRQRQIKADTRATTVPIVAGVYRVVGWVVFNDTTPASNVTIAIGTSATTTDQKGFYSLTLTKDDFWPNTASSPKSALSILFFNQNGTILTTTNNEPDTLLLPSVFAANNNAVRLGDAGTSTVRDVNNAWQSKRNFILNKP